MEYRSDIQKKKGKTQKINREHLQETKGCRLGLLQDAIADTYQSIQRIYLIQKEVRWTRKGQTNSAIGVLLG